MLVVSHPHVYAPFRYAVSIAFIVFIAVAAEAQIESAVYAAQQVAGAPLTVNPPLVSWASYGNAASAGLTSGVPTPSDPLVLASIEAVARASTRGSSSGSSVFGSGGGGVLGDALPWVWAGYNSTGAAAAAAAAAESSTASE